MAYDEKLAEKVRERFADLSHVEEKEMMVLYLSIQSLPQTAGGICARNFLKK